MKTVYKNKKTGQMVVTGQALDEKHWDKVKRFRSMQTKNAKISDKEIIKK